MIGFKVLTQGFEVAVVMLHHVEPRA
jgi:hypothetical protein